MFLNHINFEIQWENADGKKVYTTNDAYKKIEMKAFYIVSDEQKEGERA